MINVRFENWHENKIALQKKIINKTWFPKQKSRETPLIFNANNEIENPNFMFCRSNVL